MLEGSSADQSSASGIRGKEGGDHRFCHLRREWADHQHGGQGQCVSDTHEGAFFHRGAGADLCLYHQEPAGDGSFRDQHHV